VPMPRKAFGVPEAPLQTEHMNRGGFLPEGAFHLEDMRLSRRK
jgi:hypothetical protein